MAPIIFFIDILERLFFIEIKNQLFHEEIVTSALITLLIYTIQLFRNLKHFRKDVQKYHKLGKNKVLEDMGITEEEATSKAIEYPGYLIRYTLGGFIITFHLLIFVTFIPRLLYHFSFTFKWILQLLLPIFMLFALKSSTAKFCAKIFCKYGKQPSGDRQRWFYCIENLKNILQYFILVANCFIGIISAILRLVLAILFNIIYMNRMDFCPFHESFEHFDGASVAYLCCVYEQMSSISEEPSYITLSKSTDTSDMADEKITLKEEKVRSPEDTYKDDDQRIDDTIACNPSKELTLIEEQLLILQTWSQIDAEHPATRQLNRLNLKIIPVRGDGNCFFHAIRTLSDEPETKHSDIRRSATDYIVLHREQFEPFLVRTKYKTLDKYINEMKKDKCYADHLIVLATAIALETDIVIHQINCHPLLIPGKRNSTRQYHLWYDSLNEHYEIVVTHSNTCPYLPYDQLLQH